jgi:hypothetical protein
MTASELNCVSLLTINKLANGVCVCVCVCIYMKNTTVTFSYNTEIQAYILQNSMTFSHLPWKSVTSGRKRCG